MNEFQIGMLYLFGLAFSAIAIGVWGGMHADDSSAKSENQTPATLL